MADILDTHTSRRGFCATLALLCIIIITITPTTAREHHDYHKNQQSGPTLVEWTFLVFVNGNNNLDEMGDFNVNQMATVGSQPWLNIVVQQASYSRNDTRRLYVTKGKPQVLQDLGGAVNMGDVSTWEDFVQWGITNYPAKHYLLSLWDHGTGWHGPDDMVHPATSHAHAIKPKKPQLGDISCDGFTGDDCITTTQLGDALARFNRIIGRKIDIFATDACLMQMIEIAAQISDYADYFVASEAGIPFQGWPYDKFLSQWVRAGPGSRARDIASYITSQYLLAYSAGGEYGALDVTMSFLDLTQIQPVMDTVKLLAQQIVHFNDSERSVAFAGIYPSLCFDFIDYCDILSYAHILGQSLPQLLPTVSQLNQTIAKFVQQYGGLGGWRAATGLSIWLPDDVDTYHSGNANILYETMRFEQITQWGDALKYMLTGKKYHDQTDKSENI